MPNSSRQNFCSDSRECFYYIAGKTIVGMYIKTIMPFLFLYRFYTSPVCRGTIYCLNYLSELKWFWKLMLSPTTQSISFCVSSPCFIWCCRITNAVRACLCVQDALLLLQHHQTALTHALNRINDVSFLNPHKTFKTILMCTRGATLYPLS